MRFEPSPDFKGIKTALRATHLWQANASEAAELHGFMRALWQHPDAPACVQVRVQGEQAAGDDQSFPEMLWPTACTT